jgi:predicted phosphodiesterase
MKTQVSNQTPQSQSPLDQEPIVGFIKELIGRGETNASIVKALWSSKHRFETTEKSIRRFRKRHGLEVYNKAANAGYRISGDEGELTSSARQGTSMDDPDTMLRERGLDPEEWVIDSATINEWDGPSAEEGMVTYHQAKLNLRRKHPEQQLLAARSDGWVAPPRKKAATKGAQLIVVAGDQQAPFHDENLHYLFCGWLEENEPDEVTFLGDTVDYPEISRHRLDPENTATVNECTQSGYDLLRGVRRAAPNARIRKLAGNHDERLRNILLDKPSMQPLYGAKQADSPEEKGAVALGLPFLLRLDELDIEYVEPEGSYDLAQINLSHKLAVRHGWIARQGSGVSALATLEHLGYSVIVGHTHRQSIIYKTTHDIDGALTTLTAAEAGCMCRVNQTPVKGRKWPNFTPLPDWQQGFTTVTVHPNGFFRIENATYVNDALLWRDQQYR